MSDQISHDDPIWALTPTELLIAYWSLTLKKPEIAAKATIFEGTVGTHLTSIYTKLGLSEVDDEVKRSLLNSRHGQALNSVVKEIDEEFAEYADKTKALQKKKSDVLKGKKVAETPSGEPGMQSPPPPPQIQPPTRRAGLPRPVWIIGGLLVLLGLCGLFGMNAFRRLFDQTATNTPQANTQVVISATQTSPTEARNPTQTTEPSITATFTSLPPTETVTPVVQPTALTLPIKEDFSQQYSDLWRVIGNPIITENVQFADARFSGVLTTDMGDTATLWIGNTAWTDYLVSLRVDIPFRDNHLRIGLRVKDINNMVALDCGARYSECSWIIIENGQEDRIPTETQLYKDPLIITVQGDTFTAVGNYPDFPSNKMSLILPPKYKGKFTGGGVLLQITSSLTIDFIQIDPFP